jgi:Arc/MetJ family transcription regulator
MRTTLDLDDDLLQAARELATTERTTMGAVVSALVRKALTPAAAGRVRNGVPLLPRRRQAAPITMRDVNALRDDA